MSKEATLPPENGGGPLGQDRKLAPPGSTSPAIHQATIARPTGSFSGSGGNITLGVNGVALK